MKQTIKNLFRCTIALAALLITGTASADEVETFKITKAETTNGSFAVTVGGAAAEAAAAGATVTITATPSTGYEADGTPEVSVTTSWGKAGTRAEIPVEETITVTAGTTANTWTFTMPNDPVTVSMAFKQSGFAITVATGIEGGTVAVSGNKTIARPGDEIALTNTPAEGYEFDSYSVKDADGKEVTVKDGKFTMPGSAVTVSAKFKKKMTNKDITEVAIDPITFTGSALTPKPVVKDGDNTLKEGVDYTLSYSSNTDAGTATVTITGIGDYSGTVTVTFDIEKADATMTAPTAKTGLVTNGKAQELITAGSAEGGEMQYSLDGTNYSTALPTGTEAKEYTVYYKVVGDKNHNDVAAQSLKVVISKIASTGIAFVESEAVAIIGETNEFPELSNPFNLPVEWISKNEDVATVDQKGVVTLVGPGEAEIWVVFKGNADYEPVSARYRLTVVQKPAQKSGTGLAFYYGDEKVDKGSATIGDPLDLPYLSNPYGLEVEWLSSNTEVATVDQKGQVTLVGPGVTEIWIVFKGNDQFNSVAAMYRLTVEGQPVIPDTSLPVITSQPENVTYAIGDTEYPKLRVEATTTVGELTYEWFIQSEDGTYLSSGIKTAELDLQAFIDNVVEISREEAAGDYIFMCQVSNVNGTVKSETATLTITAGGTAIATVKAGTQADSVRKYVKDGRIVIETAKGIFSLSGVQIR